MVKKSNWSGWVTLHTKIGDTMGEVLARSPTYEWTGPRQAFEIAEARLRELWARDGSKLTAHDAGTAEVTSYPNLVPGSDIDD